jgi:hypothetical protein
MISCKEATELMSQEKDRPLGWGERLALQVHLKICAGCTNYRRQMDLLRAACRRLSGRDDK